MTPLIRIDLPASRYDDALELQRQCLRRVADDPHRAYLILTEHVPPVITLGRRGGPGDILASAEQLVRLGVEVRSCRRGGQATVHGPGQLVAYAILRLDRRGRGVHDHMRHLQQAAVDAIGHFGVAAGGRDGRAGVWAGAGKIASVGVAVQRWIGYHGAAMNVCNDLSLFDWIVPCGCPGERVTSVAEQIGRPVRVEDVADAFAAAFARQAGMHIAETLAGGAARNGAGPP